MLVADKNMQYALKGALSRPEALGIRPVVHEFRTHPGRDGGVRTTGPEVLAGERNRFRHALMLLDFEGCGTEMADPVALETELDHQIRTTWGDSAKTIVIAPEVDVWLWGTDNALREVLQWPLGGSIREWLEINGFAISAEGKPLRPKEAFEAMRHVHRQPRSSALYEKITNRISLQNCSDQAFLRLKEQLRVWFGPVPALPA
ncbi:MAG: hypothetical protein HY017_13360 [Betaproteobacteria bacterium]|nr:hypothetical protein [Betaproteobacteria bacterium]